MVSNQTSTRAGVWGEAGCHGSFAVPYNVCLFIATYTLLHEPLGLFGGLEQNILCDGVSASTLMFCLS